MGGAVREGFGGDLKGAEKKKFEKARKENAEVLGYKLTGKGDIKESVNEFKYNLYQKLPDKQKVLVHLISKGNKASDAKKLVNKYYDKVSKAYKKASLSKKAEIISVMSAKNEGSCGYGIDGKLGNEPAGPKLLKKKKKFDLDEACQKG